MRIAAFQMVGKAGDVRANLDLIAEAAGQAKSEGAHLLVAPELAVPGYGAGDAFASLAEPAEGSQVRELAAIAERNGVALVAGFTERAGTAVYNSAVLVTPAGDRHVYRKCHLYGPYERGHFTPGDRAPAAISLGGLKLGLLICYDVEFPEAVRNLASRGADLVVVPTALPESGHAAFIAEKIVPARAFENQIAVLYANHAGSDGRFTYAGRSCIAMPDGSDAARAGRSAAELICADYHPDGFSDSRRENPYLADRRADIF